MAVQVRTEKMYDDLRTATNSQPLKNVSAIASHTKIILLHGDTVSTHSLI